LVFNVCGVGMVGRLNKFISSLVLKYKVSSEDYDCLVKLIEEEVEGAYQRGRKEEREYIEALMGRISY